MTTTQACLIGNQKGGVGKTNTAVHLGAALGERGLRTLIIDLDPNAGATSHLGVPGDLQGTFELLAGQRTVEEVVLRAGEMACLPPGVDLIAGSRALESLDSVLARQPFVSPWDCLRPGMEQLRALALYDWVLFDVGPNQTTPSRAAYLCADAMLAVVKPELPSEQALQVVLRDIEVVRSRDNLNPGLEFLGALLTCVDRRHRLSRTYRAEYEELFLERGLPNGLLTTEIPISQSFANAWKEGHCTLFQYAPKDPALAAMRALAEEFLARAAAPLVLLPPPVRAAVDRLLKKKET